MQDQIRVDFSTLDRVGRLLNQACNELHSAAHTMPGSASNTAGGDMRVNVQKRFKCTPVRVSATTVSEALREYRRATSALGEYASILSYRVREAAERFRETEQGVQGQISAQATGSSGDNQQGGSDGSSRWDNVNFKISDIWKFISKVGPIGGAISMIGEWLTGGVSVKTGLKSAKYLAGVVEKTGKIISSSKNSFDWKTLLDFTKSTDKGFLTNLGKQIDKYNFGKATTVGEKVAVGAKWAGSILTVAVTAYDNIWENKEGNSLGRALQETVMESGIKIGEDILVGAAVGALAATVGAPAVVAGVVTVGVIWAADRVCEYFTGGKDVAETITDFTLDKVIPAVKNVRNGVINFGKNCANAAGKVISGWWKKTTKSWNPLAVGGR